MIKYKKFELYQEVELKKVKVENAIGMMIGHDLTEIVPGLFKGAAFKKGHLIKEEDIPRLLKMGKEHIYVIEIPPDSMHENDAALRIAKAIAGPGLETEGPEEGKIIFKSKLKGILNINLDGLNRINRIPDVIVSTLHKNMPIDVGETVAATRAIPLIIKEKYIKKVEEVAKKFFPILRILPYRTKKIGALVTGSEIYKGRIKDNFDNMVGRKIYSFGSHLLQKIILPDDVKMIANGIHSLINYGCDLILVTGGLSVDPDDVTRKGIKKSGAKIILYGTPVLPGAMFLYAEMGKIPILGLPACVFFNKRTVFDLVFPMVLAGVKITKDEIATWGHGGLCLNCDVCRYPICPFGKG